MTCLGQAWYDGIMTTNTPTDPYNYQPVVTPNAKNTLGIVALVIAIVGAIFACVPGALIVGWVLLPVAFILSIVALVQKDKKKGAGIAALIISVVGTIIGFLVFTAMAVTAVDEAFSEAPDTEVTEVDEPAAADDAADNAVDDVSSGIQDDGSYVVGDYVFTNVTTEPDVIDDFETVARVTSNGSADTASFTITYFSNGDIVGTSSGFADFSNSETVTVTFLSADNYSDFDYFEIQVDYEF